MSIEYGKQKEQAEPTPASGSSDTGGDQVDLTKQNMPEVDRPGAMMEHREMPQMDRETVQQERAEMWKQS